MNFRQRQGSRGASHALAVKKGGDNNGASWRKVKLGGVAILGKGEAKMSYKERRPGRWRRGKHGDFRRVVVRGKGPRNLGGGNH